MKYLFFSCLLLTIRLCAFSQSQELHLLQRSADAAQRVTLRDSLAIDDTVVSGIFSLRDKMVQQLDQLHRQSSLGRQEQDAQAVVIRNQTNEAIKALLGEDRYRRYLQLIQNRMRERGATGLPLAGATN